MNVAQIIALVNRSTHRLVHNKALSCWTVEAYCVSDDSWRPGVIVGQLDAFNASAGLTMYPTNSDVTYYYASEHAALSLLADAQDVDETCLPLPMRYALSLARQRGLVEAQGRVLRLSSEGRALMTPAAAGAQ